MKYKNWIPGYGIEDINNQNVETQNDTQDDVENTDYCNELECTNKQPCPNHSCFFCNSQNIATQQLILHVNNDVFELKTKLSIDIPLCESCNKSVQSIFESLTSTSVVHAYNILLKMKITTKITRKITTPITV